jgi:hypothetical protein
MGLEAAIITTAAAHTGLTALIGSSPMRLRPVVATQRTTYPAISYRLVSEARDETMGTTSTVIRRRVEFQIQSNAAAAYVAGQAVAAQLIDCFDRFSGDVETESTGVTFPILDTFIDQVQDLAYDLDTDVYTRVVDIIFICGE